MNILKNVVTIMSCSMLVATTAISPAAYAETNLDIANSYESMVDKKGYNINCSDESLLSSEINKKFAITFFGCNYDPEASQKYGRTVYKTSLDFTDLGENLVVSLNAWLENKDGSIIEAEVIEFVPNMYGEGLIVFPTNDIYWVSAEFSSGRVSTSPFIIDKVKPVYDENDDTPPEITINIPDLSEYKEGDEITVKISSNELCKMKIEDDEYMQCTSVDYKISKSGVYTVTATDINGNPVKKSFTIKYPNVITPEFELTTATTTTTTTTTKSTTKSTTTTTKPTTTTTTTKPTTTTTTTKPTTKPTTTTTTTTTTPTTTTVTKPVEIIVTLKGDANCDGKVSIADATAILQSMGNPDRYGLSRQGLYNADVENTGNGVTIGDAVLIQRYDAKIIDKF